MFIKRRFEQNDVSHAMHTISQKSLLNQVKGSLDKNSKFCEPKNEKSEVNVSIL